MGEIAIKFFRREVTLRENVDGDTRYVAKLGPSLHLCWHAQELALLAGASRVSPAAAADTVQRAAEILEERLTPLEVLFTAPAACEGPVPIALHCPKCSTEHVDRDEWATKPHRTHLCEKCGNEWQPCDFDSVGVASNPEESEADVFYANGGHDGPGWYYWDSEYPEEGSIGTFESFEEAARHAATAYYRVRPPALARPAEPVKAVAGG